MLQRDRKGRVCVLVCVREKERPSRLENITELLSDAFRFSFFSSPSSQPLLREHIQHIYLQPQAVPQQSAHPQAAYQTYAPPVHQNKSTIIFDDTNNKIPQVIQSGYLLGAG